MTSCGWLSLSGDLWIDPECGLLTLPHDDPLAVACDGICEDLLCAPSDAAMVEATTLGGDTVDVGDVAAGGHAADAQRHQVTAAFQRPDMTPEGAEAAAGPVGHRLPAEDVEDVALGVDVAGVGHGLQCLDEAACDS